MKAKPLVKVNTNRRKLVAKRVAGSCGCGKKKNESYIRKAQGVRY